MSRGSPGSDYRTVTEGRRQRGRAGTSTRSHVERARTGASVINHGLLQMTLISNRGPCTASSVVPMADHAGQGALR